MSDTEQRYTINELWNLACEEEGIDSKTPFVEFRPDNYWAKRYNQAVADYFTAKQKASQLSGE